ncbi:cobaltochelatase subunit CobN [Dermatophilus congolensis]|uniref:cobaltochelatase subunit CobN n=3 Tax=Dermatophilus congolensis TaxID=1863 RepID=UPI001AAE3DB7|nr:cobaltochelatase subunit CobN [Dermatophilus congolensis]MBO3152799.1 cobaltochelatase subunit CobN [Dermatophilus congolensis]MBO3160191.1 cobaltochelatase subunit CobN [Dermatophilus congolensis]MBO3164084.1 cobaltochelatase subunit CobN [Dermatophilus congolensis]MBO3177629.1 cobaltochelatase subunit CobN [Dermatophilus congolensis]
MTRIALLSTSDTDLLAARGSGANYIYANPSRLEREAWHHIGEGSGNHHEDTRKATTHITQQLHQLTNDADLVIYRYLGSAAGMPEHFPHLQNHLNHTNTPLIVLGGEQAPDASLMAYSTVPIGVAAQAHIYLAQGGPENLTNLHAFLADTVLLTGDAFEPPTQQPFWGTLPRTQPTTPRPDGYPRPRIGIIFYRAQYTAGNTTYVHALADAIDNAGGVGTPIFAASLREAPDDLLEHLSTYDTLITTVLASGGAATNTANVTAGGDDEAWNVEALARLDLPIIQGLCLTWSRNSWENSDDGMSPLDAATQVAIPEFDGRLISTAFSFKEIDNDGLPHYVPDPERCARVAGIAVRHGLLRHIPPHERRIAIVLSAYPTKHSRIGNAVGLDTPVSVVRLLRRMAQAGYNIGNPGDIPGIHPPSDTELAAAPEHENPETTSGNALIHALIDAGGQDPDWLTAEQLSGQPIRIPAATYRQWFANLPEPLQNDMTQHWGEAPGKIYVDHNNPNCQDPDGEIVGAALRADNVVLLVQPPRGFGENPIAIYHDPDLPPTHHYLAVYRWIDEIFGAHAVVHVGKHGNLEWLSGKSLALDATAGPDAALGSMPLIYPFLVNDPGEGTQAKRRAHATLIDHLVPPMARAETYGDIARLEQLLDEYSSVSVMDPAKAPALQGEIWTLLQAAKMDRDLGLEARPSEDEFDDMLLHVDGWLCEIKDAQIRDGLHTLGQAPTGEARVNLVLAILRANQMFGGTIGAIPGLRVALGLDEGADRGGARSCVDTIEKQARALVQALEDTNWDITAIDEAITTVLDTSANDSPIDIDAVRASLVFACTEVIPRLAGTAEEIEAVMHALDGRFIKAGPSGSPLRGLINVLPTGRNFYAVDPRAIPSRLAWETGRQLADTLLERYLAETGEYPPSVGLSMWGTSAMRTSGDDIAEVLALIGVRPVWDEASRRVTGVEPIPLEELGRPRIDVTVRISGFFRDAFPYVVTMLDDAISLVAELEEPADQNYVRAHVHADVAEGTEKRRATSRIFGSKPGTYGAGLLPLLESGNWRSDADLAEVYATWGGYAYGRELDGVPARGDMERAYRRITVAAKNVDTREHDIADSDDYFQYHGGMIATVRALTGNSPKSYVGDSTTPDAVRTRSLAEETARVFRARVVNPRWIGAMQRHGYKGAFEMAATVDYMFGFDATAGVVEDWMYEKLAESYVLDEKNQEFLKHANPWALHGIVERLKEAADRGLWENPDSELMDQLLEVYMDVEGDLEDSQS